MRRTSVHDVGVTHSATARPPGGRSDDLAGAAVPDAALGNNVAEEALLGVLGGAACLEHRSVSSTIHTDPRGPLDNTSHGCLLAGFSLPLRTSS